MYNVVKIESCQSCDKKLLELTYLNINSLIDCHTCHIVSKLVKAGSKSIHLESPHYAWTSK